MDSDARLRRLEEKVAHMERLQQLLDGVVREQELRLQQLVRRMEDLRGSGSQEEGQSPRV
jgi:uncharacterized coiled-coil protein SlyX